MQFQSDAAIGTFVHHQHGTPENDHRLGNLARNLESSLALQREQAIKELIMEHRDPLSDSVQLVNENIVNFIRENIDSIAAADFWNAPIDGFYIVTCWFFADQDSLFEDQTIDGMERELATRAIRRDFRFEQWIRLDSIKNVMVDALQRLDFMRGRAEAIESLDLFDRWAAQHPTHWYRNAMDLMKIVKPRVDEIRATWNDLGGAIMQIAKRHSGKPA